MVAMRMHMVEAHGRTVKKQHSSMMRRWVSDEGLSATAFLIPSAMKTQYFPVLLMSSIR